MNQTGSVIPAVEFISEHGLFNAEQCGLEHAFVVVLPYLDHPLWLVSGLWHVLTLEKHGVPRRHIWRGDQVRGFFKGLGEEVNSLEDAAYLFASLPESWGG